MNDEYVNKISKLDKDQLGIECMRLKEKVSQLEKTLCKLTELVDNEVDVNMSDLEYEDFKKQYNEILDKAGWNILKILFKDTLKLIKEMRDITGASMQICKMFLEVTNYNLDDAIGLLRERAIAINSPITRVKTLEEAYRIYKSYERGGSNE